MDLAQEGKERVVIMSDKIDSMQNLKEIVINELRPENFCVTTNPGEPVETIRNTLVQDLYALEDFDELQFRNLRVDVFGKVSQTKIFSMSILSFLQYFLTSEILRCYRMELGRRIISITLESNSGRFGAF